MSKIPVIPEKYLNNKYFATIGFNYSEFVDEGYWKYKSAKDWDCMGSSSGGGESRRFINECTTYGPCDQLLEELKTIVDYLNDRNDRGAGRYKLYLTIYGSVDNDIDFGDEQEEYIIIIDDNRELDKFTYDVPYDLKKRVMNFNFTE